MIWLNKKSGRQYRELETVSLSLSLKNQKTHDDKTLSFYGEQYVHIRTHTHTHTHAYINGHTYMCVQGYIHTQKMPGSCGHEITTNTCPSLSNLAH